MPGKKGEIGSPGLPGYDGIPGPKVELEYLNLTLHVMCVTMCNTFNYSLFNLSFF